MRRAYGGYSLAGNLPEIPKTEILHATVSADQADYIYKMLYEEKMGEENLMLMEEEY